MMGDKKVILFAAAVGSTLGGYAPSLFGAGPFSAWGIVGTFVGGIAGIYFSYRWLN